MELSRVDFSDLLQDVHLNRIDNILNSELRDVFLQGDVDSSQFHMEIMKKMCSKDGYILEKYINLTCVYYVAHSAYNIIVSYLDINSVIAHSAEGIENFFISDYLFKLFSTVKKDRVNYLNELWC